MAVLYHSSDVLASECIAHASESHSFEGYYFCPHQTFAHENKTPLIYIYWPSIIAGQILYLLLQDDRISYGWAEVIFKTE